VAAFTNVFPPARRVDIVDGTQIGLKSFQRQALLGRKIRSTVSAHNFFKNLKAVGLNYAARHSNITEKYKLDPPPYKGSSQIAIISNGSL